MQRHNLWPQGSVYDVLRTRLYDCGLFEEFADAVMAALMTKIGPRMKGRWGDPADAYPKTFIAFLWVAARKEAVKWIDANLPQHWAREAFV
jgi:hypothetical protein